MKPEIKLDNNPVLNETEHKNPDYGKTFEQLITENEKFAYSIVNNEFSKYSWQIKEDLYSAAKYGLIYAATKYDSKQEEAKFISYGVNWIRYYVHEEVRKLNQIKLNQNFVVKRNKIVKTALEYKKEHGKEPTTAELAKILNISEKVINNVYNINHGENYNFISFQALMNANNNKDNNEGSMENKLMNEYIEESSTAAMDDYELRDLLSVLKTKVSEEDYNIFIDRHINGLSFADIAKKYKLNFASSASYKLKNVEKICKELLN